MPTLVATAGSGTANSYATVAEGDTYFDERLNASAWTGASADDKARALIMATRRLDAENYEGIRRYPGTDTETSGTQQALQWPRQSTDSRDGWTYDDDEIPTIVKHATFEMALRILNDGTTDTLADTGLEQFENVKVGSLDVTPRAAYRADKLPEIVSRLLAPVLKTSRGNVRLLRA